MTVGRRACLAAVLVTAFWLGAGGGETAGGPEAPGQRSEKDEDQKERESRLQEIKKLNRRAQECYQQARHSEAVQVQQQALSLCRRLYPKDKFPAGHADLVGSLTALGLLLQALGDYGGAEPHLREALAMQRALFPPDKFPAGHLQLVMSVNNLGFLLQARGDLGGAEPYFREALALCRTLYPKDKFPEGHINLATSLANLGSLLQAHSDNIGSEPFLREALALCRTLYPTEKFPRGHPHLAMGLRNVGLLLQYRGDYAAAEPYLREVVALCRALYPKDKFPEGHANLAMSLNELGQLLFMRGDAGGAEPLLRQALAMRRALFPKDKLPDGHPDLAASLNNLGAFLLYAQGDCVTAEPFLRDALAMSRLLYPKDRFSRGSTSLATCLDDLGFLLCVRADYAGAEPLLRDALAMRRALYPKETFPCGHAELAVSLSNVGALLQAHGDYAGAEPLLRDAVAMWLALYPKETFANNHPHLATSLTKLGSLLAAQEKYALAERCYRDALAVRRAHYPPETFPDGHPQLVGSLGDLGMLLWMRKKHAEAEPLLREAFAMSRALYPRDKFPEGNVQLVNSLWNRGSFLLLVRGEYAQAEALNRHGLLMAQRLAALFADVSAEAESLNYLDSLPFLAARSLFLASTAHTPDIAPADTYAVLWQGKAILAQTLERRYRHLRQLDDDQVRVQLRELRDARQQLARLLFGAVPPAEERAQLLQRLTAQKEDLERRLAAKLPAVRIAPPASADLIERLPADSAFVDLYCHLHAEKAMLRPHLRYVAFVLRKGHPVRRVELGPIEPIEKALADWRQAITAGLDSPAAAELRRRVWEPLAAHLPDQADSTIYLCPDGGLSALPWAALPGRAKGTVLLEEHALVLVPHGPFLVERLRQRDQGQGPSAPSGAALVVGAVGYDRPADPPRGAEVRIERRPADRSGKAGTWPDLPNSAREADHVAALARGLRPPPQVISRAANAASPEQLLTDLPEARWAHLATHGFFAAPASAARQHLFEEKDFLRGIRGERLGAAARNPLTQSGLVLAGANLKGSAAGPDGGILTAEAIAGLDLTRLELAVLSACETGLGEATAGEGVFGLQRAFHQGGCRNVVASLWKVDDEATAALMHLFYEQLWKEGRPPREALRQAQLTLYRQPAGAKLAAEDRGPDFDKMVKRPAQPQPVRSAPTGHALPRDWAAFVLSGAGW